MTVRQANGPALRQTPTRRRSGPHCVPDVGSEYFQAVPKTGNRGDTKTMAEAAVLDINRFLKSMKLGAASATPTPMVADQFTKVTDEVGDEDRFLSALAALVFNVDPVAEPELVNPYNYVTSTWTSPLVYFALTFFNWLILGVASLTWIVVMWRFWRHKLNPHQHGTLLFLCLAFAAFSIQVVVSAFADLSGSIGANLQVRLFTPVMMFGVPLAAIGVFTVVQRVQLPTRLRPVIVTLVAIAFLYFEFAALSKAANEPLFSNKWVFITRPEQATATWLSRYGISGSIWTGVDERYRSDLHVVSTLLQDDADKQMQLYNGSSLNTDYYVWSEVERARWIRLNLYMPNVLLSSRHLIYDNGSTQIYRRPALTIYQD